MLVALAVKLMRVLSTCRPEQNQGYVTVHYSYSYIPNPFIMLALHPLLSNRPAVKRFAPSDSSSFHVALKHPLWNVGLLTLHSFPSLCFEIV